MNEKSKNAWSFIGKDGTFTIDEPHRNSYLYFPLVNEAGMMSSITPTLMGDIKTGQNTFFNLPVSADDLHNLKSGRNFWLYVEGKGAWSAGGSSSWQIANNFVNEEEEKVNLEAGFLWQKVTRENLRLQIRSEITSFVPANDDTVELMKVEITNTGKEEISITPTSAIPIYGRSAANVRDHRHVTGLLNRIYTIPAGIEVQPAMTFDERGHKVNEVTYCVFGSEDSGELPMGFFPNLEEFIGEGGCLEWPETIVNNLQNLYKSGEHIDGYEAIGALRFRDISLMPEESKAYIIAIGVNKDRNNNQSKLQKYLSSKDFDKYLDENKEFWSKKLSRVSFSGNDEKFDMWMKWVTLQPELRRIYGCSFMPHHDYGKGGRGWRDLWQDCLALLLMEPETVRSQLFENFAGVRMDGTNATIIGSKPGEFVADRNDISRVWSDHGVWPLFTTLLYINQSGDIDFLLNDQTYFKDRLVRRAREVDTNWTLEYGNKQRQNDNNIYNGTIIEHLLLENLVAFFNVGDNNNIKLENADWNDALDMAYEKGETVAFSSFYAGNLMNLRNVLLELKIDKGIQHISIAKEIMTLLDSICGGTNYDSVESKRSLLNSYYDKCIHNISGEKVSCSVEALAKDLEKKALWLMENIRKNEWINDCSGFEWFNGYYDNSGIRVEGRFDSGIRMTLTGQVFPLMMGVATDEQIKKVIASVNKYLYDSKIGGYRLNTNFKELKLNMGRGFGFAFGHKENGAMFSHMAVMYAFALYKRGFVSDGYDVLTSIYDLCSDFEKSRIYPGIPEYINEKGRGMYHYLTGAASWLLFLVLTQVYGIKGRLGDLEIEPKLLRKQFNSCKKASVKTVFADRNIEVTYINEKLLNYGEYSIECIKIDGHDCEFTIMEGSAIINRKAITSLESEGKHCIEVILI